MEIDLDDLSSEQSSQTQSSFSCQGNLVQNPSGGNEYSAISASEVLAEFLGELSAVQTTG